MKPVEPPAARADGPAPLRDRLKNYLLNGGLFNPEHMEHQKVQWLLIDFDAALTAALAEVATLKEERSAIQESAVQAGFHETDMLATVVTLLSDERAMLRAEVTTLHQAHQWQPIATVPDWVEFIIGAWLVNDGTFDVGELSREAMNWFSIVGSREEPTHWMPLPAAPDPAGLARRAARPQPEP